MKNLSFQIILIFLITSVQLLSQKENYNWYFYDSCAITFNTPDLEPQPLSNCKVIGVTPAPATVSDSNGNLLFYSGNTGSIQEIFDRNSTGLIGNKEHIRSWFSAIFPYPGKKNLYAWVNYYILAEPFPLRVIAMLRIDIIDLTKRDGLGDIVQTIYKPTDCIIFAAIKHSNNIDWWLCGVKGYPREDSIKSYLLTSDGIVDSSMCSSFQPVGIIYFSAMTYPTMFNTVLKSDSVLFLWCYGGFLKDWTYTNKFISLINFNRTTGKFNTSGDVKICDTCGTWPPIFSPSGGKIYVPIARHREIIPGRLYQVIYELYQCKFSSNPNEIPQTMRKIGPTKTNLSNESMEGDSIWWFFQMKQGPNGKIYILHKGANYISEISNPDAEAEDVIYKDTAVSFGNRKVYCFPWTLYNGYNLWLELSSNSPICYGDSVHLTFSLSDPTKKPQKVVWSGPDSFSSEKQNPSLLPRRSGFYRVTVFVDGAKLSDSIWVEVFNPAPKIIGPKRFCDTIEIGVEREYLSYFWSTGDTTKSIKVHNAGRYYVIVVDSNNCIGSDTVFIESLVPAKIVGSKVICKGKATVLEAFPKGDQYRYQWSTGEKSQSISIDKPGTYWVEVTDTNGCRARAEISVDFFVVSLTGTDIIDFGGVEVDSSKTKVLSLQNHSNAAIRIKAVKLKHKREEFDISFSTPLELGEGEETSLSVSYRNRGKLYAVDTIVIEVDSPCEELFEIPLIARVSGLKTYVWLPDTTALVGTRSFCIPLRVRTESGRIEGVSYEATIGYDATALFPDNPAIPIENGERIVNLSGEGLTIGKESTTIGLFCGEVLLARSERTPLHIKKFEWKDSGITAEAQDGSLSITGVCMPNFSQIELFQPTNVIIIPNLTDEQVEITIEGARNSSHLLEITNVIGMRLESRVITLDNTQKKVTLRFEDYPSGIYFLRVGNKVGKLLKL